MGLAVIPNMADAQTALVAVPVPVIPGGEKMEIDHGAENRTPPSGRACHECNRKKTKCDRKRPICGLCQRTGIGCNYPLRRKPPTPSQARPGSKVQKLRTNIDRLLQLLESNPAELIRSRNTHGNRSGDTITVATPSVRLTAPERIQIDEDDEDDNDNDNNGEGTTPDGPAEPTIEDDIRSLKQLSSRITELDWTEATARPISISGDSKSVSTNTPNMEDRRLSSATSTSNSFDLSYSVVLHLVDLYFDKVQPWLPLLHKPTFESFLNERLDPSSTPLKNMNDEQMVLMYALFALSARFSTLPMFADVEPLERGRLFFDQASSYYNRTRELTSANLTYLQGCILLAFYIYTFEPTSRGWILVGVCVRLAYELGLADMDDENSDTDLPLEWIRQEEMRRAWWLVWELDTFGSAIHKRPFAIDRRRMIVKLPVSDEAWFAGREIGSAKLITRTGRCWASLQECENQDERAWFLISNFLMAAVQDVALRGEKISADEKFTIENEITCLKLGLPTIFNIEADTSLLEHASSSTINWVLGTRLMLLYATLNTAGLFVTDADKADASRPLSRPDAMRKWTHELSRIVSKWPAAYIPLAQPFLACMVMPPLVVSTQVTVSEDLMDSTWSLSDMTLSHFGTAWKLGKSLLRKLQSPRPGKIT